MNLIDWAGVGGLIIACAAIITALIARYKAPAERSNTQAGTAEIYDRIAEKAAARALRLDERVDALERENSTLSKKIILQDTIISDMQILIDRLTHQVLSLGGVPIKPKEKNNEP